MARYSEAHKRAIAKYQKANYYKITALIPKRNELVVKERIKEFGSISGYINYLINQDLHLTDDSHE